jgi:hypothetical protein
MVTPAVIGAELVFRNGPDVGAAVEVALNNGEGATVLFALAGAMVAVPFSRGAVAVPFPMGAETGEVVAFNCGPDSGAA